VGQSAVENGTNGQQCKQVQAGPSKSITDGYSSLVRPVAAGVGCCRFLDSIRPLDSWTAASML
jgi:hypothetical protein